MHQQQTGGEDKLMSARLRVLCACPLIIRREKAREAVNLWRRHESGGLC